MKNVELVVEKCLTGFGTGWQTYSTDLKSICTNPLLQGIFVVGINYVTVTTVSKTVLSSNKSLIKHWHFVSSMSGVQNWNAFEFVTSFLSTADVNNLRVHSVYQWNLIIFEHWVTRYKMTVMIRPKY